MRNDASVPTTRWGRAATIDQLRLNAPESFAFRVPAPRLGTPTTIVAASANVRASATNNILVEFGFHANMAPANPKPTAPASIVVADTIALALPTCPGGTRAGIAA